MDDLHSVPAACIRLGGISKWTLYQWISKGKVARTKIGRRTMIRESELIRIIDAGTNNPNDNKRS